MLGMLSRWSRVTVFTAGDAPQARVHDCSGRVVRGAGQEFSKDTMNTNTSVLPTQRRAFTSAHCQPRTSGPRVRRACGLAMATLISACALSLRAADFYSEPLDTQPAGWTTAGQWAFGVPLGQGSAVAGQYYADPTAGCTGTNVNCANLAGH